MGQKIVALSFH